MSYWGGAFFSRAWGGGPVRQLRRWFLGAPGLHFRPRPMRVAGSTAGVEAVVGGLTEVGGWRWLDKWWRW